jgi:acetyltransferase
MAAIIVTQGFADADDEGNRLQKEIVSLAKDYGIRILGPNSLGVANAFSGFTSSFLEVSNEKIPIGLIAQSGLFMMGHHILKNVHAGFGMGMDLGNACDINFSDVLGYYENEDNVRVIQIHMEALGDGKEFLQTATRVSSKKPIIALKSGKTKSGEKAVISHSGAAAGEGEVYNAAFKKAGIVTAKNSEELRLLSKAFLTYPPIKGKRVAIMSNSGAACILSIDAMEEAGLRLAEFSGSTAEALKELFPQWMDVANPLDIWIAVSSNFHVNYPKILEYILRDNNVDAVLCINPFFTLPKHEEYNSSVHTRELAKKYPEKPILCWGYGLDVEGFSEEIEKDGTAMVFPSLEAAAGTLKKLNQYEIYRRNYEKEQKFVNFQVDHEKVKSILENHRKGDQKYLFKDGLEILKAYKNKVASWTVAKDKQELPKMANDINYPAVMKIISPDIIHKSDVGGIKLNIESYEELIQNHEEMLSEIRSKMPHATISGVLIQEMAPKGKEIMIGAKKDPVFGHCIILGAGGIYTEVLKDYAFRIAPLSEEDAFDMVSEINYYKLLKGVRGEPPCHIQSIVNTLLSISQLVCDFPEIGELDINPLTVYEDGAVIVDARIVLDT